MDTGSRWAEWHIRKWLWLTPRPRYDTDMPPSELAKLRGFVYKGLQKPA